MCIGLRSAFSEGFLTYFLSGRLASFHRRLIRLYFRRVRVCRVVHEVDHAELSRCRTDVCDCRIIEKACSHRLDLCFKIDGKPRGDDTPADVPAVSEAAFQDGLVRMRVETLGTKIEYCHCCSCCCHALRVARRMGPGQLLPSGHFPREKGNCRRCGQCEKACPLGIRDRHEADLELCLGCGLCVHACPEENLQMQPWRQGEPAYHREDRETVLRKSRLVARLIGVFMTVWVCAAYWLYQRRRTALQAG